MGYRLAGPEAELMAAKKCMKRNRSGKPCGAPAGLSGLCAFHANPERARELGARGGRGNRHVPPTTPAMELTAPKDAAGVRDAFARIMADVHNGTLDTKRATTAVYAGMAFIKALETSDLESRIKSLEEKADAGIQKQT